MSKQADTGTRLNGLLQFAKENKAYWIVPLLIALAFLAFVIVGGEPPSPFKYAPF